MNMLRTVRLMSGSLATLALLGVAGSVHAEPLAVDGVSALDAARQISDKYGVNVVFKGNFRTAQPVSFTLPDGDTPGSRLEAINALANAAGADFSKTYVISRVGEGQDLPPIHIDSNANVAFQSTTVSVQDAISAVAAVDNATVQMPDAMGGTVTLSSTQMSDGDAANEIAAQTHTRWKVFYALTPRLAGHQKVADAQAAAAQQAAAQQAAADQQAMAANNGYPAGYNPFAYDPNNFNYYNPYGFGGYTGPFGGYGGFEGAAAPGTQIGPGLIIGNGGGLVFQNGFGFGYP
jgi:hypothetical protein